MLVRDKILLYGNVCDQTNNLEGPDPPSVEESRRRVTAKNSRWKLARRQLAFPVIQPLLSSTVEVFAYVKTSDMSEFYHHQDELYLAIEELVTSLGIEMA